MTPGCKAASESHDYTAHSGSTKQTTAARHTSTSDSYHPHVDTGVHRSERTPYDLVARATKCTINHYKTKAYPSHKAKSGLSRTLHCVKMRARMTGQGRHAGTMLTHTQRQSRTLEFQGCGSADFGTPLHPDTP